MEKQENKRVPLMNLDFPRRRRKEGEEEERGGKGRKTQELETCLPAGSVLKGD